MSEWLGTYSIGYFFYDGVLNRDFELEPTPVNDFSSLEYISNEFINIFCYWKFF